MDYKKIGSFEIITEYIKFEKVGETDIDLSRMTKVKIWGNSKVEVSYGYTNYSQSKRGLYRHYSESKGTVQIILKNKISGKSVLWWSKIPQKEYQELPNGRYGKDCSSLKNSWFVEKLKVECWEYIKQNNLK